MEEISIRTPGVCSFHVDDVDFDALESFFLTATPESTTVSWKCINSVIAVLQHVDRVRQLGTLSDLRAVVESHADLVSKPPVSVAHLRRFVALFLVLDHERDITDEEVLNLFKNSRDDRS